MIPFLPFSTIAADLTNTTTPAVTKTLPVAAQSEPKTFFDNLREKGWSLNKNMYAQDAGGPSSFKFDHDYTGTGKVTYSSSAALQWRAAEDKTANTSALFSVESDVANKENDANDFYRFRVGYESDFVKHGSDGTSSRSWITTTNVMLETDTPWQHQNVLLESTFQPLIPSLGDGKRLKVTPGISFAWQPVTIIGAGYSMKSNTGNRDVSRVGEDGTANFYFTDLAKSLGCANVRLYVEDKVLYNPFFKSNRWDNLFGPVLSFGLTKNFSVALSYTLGDDSPNFQKVDKFTLSMGIKF